MSSIISRLFDDASLEPSPITIDGVLYILKSDRRRDVVDAMGECERASKRELVDAIDPDRDERKALTISLHQTHLPRLTDFDVLEEVEPDVYEPGPAFETVAETLDSVREGMA